MTRVEHAVLVNGKEVKRVTSYVRACEIRDVLRQNMAGRRVEVKAVYTEFDPNDTPEKLKAMREHAEKVQRKLAEKRALKN